MPKQSSQWDFGGELFPQEAVRRVLSVTELTREIRRALEKQVGEIWVTGEITNLRLQSSGHIYFTLKDAGAQLSCVLFRGDSVANRGALADGRKVVLKGQITVYEPRGQYQLQVQAVELQGVGALQAAFEKLKERLGAEGLFAPERKRPLPQFPQRIGLVTSPTGAAIRDILHVMRRRNPAVEIILAPCAVQGAGAAGEIAAAIGLLNEWSQRSPAPLDVILVTRGGGSLEDLWAFNEEVVARAIFGSAVPVMSAVGHEIDFTISDFVADARAATPSAAAEILTEGVFSSARRVREVPAQLAELVRRRLAGEERHFEQLAHRLQTLHPRRQLNARRQQADELQLSLSRGAGRELDKLRKGWQSQCERLARLRPARMLTARRELPAGQERRLQELARLRLAGLRQRCTALAGRLQLLGPEQVLARGYSITQDAATGRVLRAAGETRPGQEIKTRLKMGEVRSVVQLATSPPSRTPRGGGGFSLMELVVVLALLIIMSTMMSSHLTGAHRRSNRELCRKNLQEIFVAFSLYANDNQGAFPQLKEARTSEAPLSLLVPRSTTETAMFICPGSSDKALPEGESFAQRRISYAYYMGRSTNHSAGEVLLTDWQVDTRAKTAGQPLFSADGKKPGNNHDKDGGNLLLGSGEVLASGPKAERDLSLPPGVALLNPKPE
ncbi:MAG: exodeoxyribonuclease VII large subunit [Verrucomicrobiota bacterium]|jgi:exodeoxyribonuclease VII large subunit